MSVDIVFATRYGSTREVAERIGSKVNAEVRLHDLGESQPTGLEGARAIAIGTPFYAGKVPRQVRRFVRTNRRLLASLPTLLFVTCFYKASRAKMQVAENFPVWLLAHVSDEYYVGGRIVVDQLRPVDRAPVRRIGVTGGEIDTIDAAEIDRIAADLDRIVAE
jgi:menaquinone-dependent protoporphyrinogen oxidase